MCLLQLPFYLVDTVLSSSLFCLSFFPQEYHDPRYNHSHLVAFRIQCVSWFRALYMFQKKNEKKTIAIFMDWSSVLILRLEKNEKIIKSCSHVVGVVTFHTAVVQKKYKRIKEEKEKLPRWMGP